MKIAQQIASGAIFNGAAETMDTCNAKAIACDYRWLSTDQDWDLCLTKYTFDDNSVVIFSGAEVYGLDADDAESIRGYAVWLWKNTEGDSAQRAGEHAEIRRLLEALN